MSAPAHPLPQTVFYSIEYPGYIKSTSVSYAIRTLGGQSSIESTFRRTANKVGTPLELNMRPGNPFAHPIPGDVVGTSNVLMKVVKRKRKRVSDDDEHIGEYTIEALGVISKTVRFRSMADYQFQPDTNDPVAKLRMAMDRMDAEAIRQFKILPDNEEYTVSAPPSDDVDPQLQSVGNGLNLRSNLRMFPPPVFCRQGIPQNYNFKGNPASMVTTVVDEETGEEKKRLINKMRWKGYGPVSIVFGDPTVPEKPPETVEAASASADQRLLRVLQEHLEARPIWTRMSLLNQFTASEARDIRNSKILLPLVCYVFQDGPWRDTLVRFGYDPRKDIKARFYQRLYFRNANHPIARPSVATRRQDRALANTQGRSTGGEREGEERRDSHIFDGVTITKDTAAFQLCDITDGMLKRIIEDEGDLRDTCIERDGWYTTAHFERIKTVLRHKFFSLLEGHVATDEECEALIAAHPVGRRMPTSRSQKPRAGKHNMAKGALRPEDAAAIRLRAALDRNVRSMRDGQGS